MLLAREWFCSEMPRLGVSETDKDQTYNNEHPFAIARMRMHMSNRRNVVLYLDKELVSKTKELVSKTKELGFNLSKTFENHLKQLLTQFSQVNSVNNNGDNKTHNFWWAGPDLNRRPSANWRHSLRSISFRSGGRQSLMPIPHQSDASLTMKNKNVASLQ